MALTNLPTWSGTRIPEYSKSMICRNAVTGLCCCRVSLTDLSVDLVDCIDIIGPAPDVLIDN